MRHTTSFSIYHARCDVCEWHTSSRNAVGLAALHHDRTGHSTYVEVERGISFLNDADYARWKAEKGGRA